MEGDPRQAAQVEAAYQGVEARWLLPGKTPGMPVTSEKVQQTFEKTLRAVGKRKIRPLDLRHTYATLAIQAGVPLLAISRQLGHASIAITADGYAHAMPGATTPSGPTARLVELGLSGQVFADGYREIPPLGS